MEIIPKAFSPLYPQAFISDQFFGFTRQYANKQCILYPRGTSVGKGSAKVKHERNAIMQHHASHAPVFKLHPVQLPVEPPLGQRKLL